MFEFHHRPLQPWPAYIRRVIRYTVLAMGIIIGSLALGIIGYRVFGGMSWVDALLNASMILGGMGPVNPLYTNAGKIFASCYALFSGVIFLIAVGVLMAPLLHRLLHRFHLDIDDEGTNEKPLSE